MKVKSKKSEGTIVIQHAQSVKQSANYQSADCSYSFAVTVPNNPKAVRRGVRQVEELVEKALATKVAQQRKFLLTISDESSRTPKTRGY